MPPSPSASIVEKHRHLVQSTWKLVEEGLGTEATQLFYDRLFESYPEVKPMFKNSQGDFDVNEQAEKLFDTVGTAVDYLSDVGSIVPMLEELGRKVSSEALMCSIDFRLAIPSTDADRCLMLPPMYLYSHNNNIFTQQ